MTAKLTPSVVTAYNSMYEVLSLLQEMGIANDANALSKRMTDAIVVRAVDMLAKARCSLCGEYPDLREETIKKRKGGTE